MTVHLHVGVAKEDVAVGRRRRADARVDVCVLAIQSPGFGESTGLANRSWGPSSAEA